MRPDSTLAELRLLRYLREQPRVPLTIAQLAEATSLEAGECGEAIVALRHRALVRVLVRSDHRFELLAVRPD